MGEIPADTVANVMKVLLPCTYKSGNTVLFLISPVTTSIVKLNMLLLFSLFNTNTSAFEHKNIEFDNTFGYKAVEK